jgi:hypothetical protein
LTNREVATVTGTVVEPNLQALTVNGQVATVTAGAFAHPLILAEGANLITVVATDRAGNQTTASVTVTRDTGGPTLINVLPATDVTLTPGQSLTIAFDADPGLIAAGYKIVLAGASSGGATNDEVNMTETSPGHYQGSYTAPAGTAFAGARVQVWGQDVAGNRTYTTANGRLTVAAPQQNLAPVAQIVAPASPKKGKDLTFDGSRSYDPDGRIVRYVWNWGDKTPDTEGAVVTHRFKKAGTYRVTLTVTDDQGATNTTMITLVVR